jgi:hypothetical protein
MDAALLGMILAYVCALQINPLDGEMRSLACLFLLGFFLFESLLCIQYASQANNLIDSQQEMHPWWRR